MIWQKCMGVTLVVLDSIWWTGAGSLDHGLLRKVTQFSTLKPRGRFARFHAQLQ
jgi:hypothetical protein